MAADGLKLNVDLAGLERLGRAQHHSADIAGRDCFQHRQRSIHHPRYPQQRDVALGVQAFDHGIEHLHVRQRHHDFPGAPQHTSLREDELAVPDDHSADHHAFPRAVINRYLNGR